MRLCLKTTKLHNTPHWNVTISGPKSSYQCSALGLHLHQGCHFLLERSEQPQSLPVLRLLTLTVSHGVAQGAEILKVKGDSTYHRISTQEKVFKNHLRAGR